MSEGVSQLKRFVEGKETNTFGLHFISTADTKTLAENVRSQVQGILDMARSNGSEIAKNERVTIEHIPAYESFECGESISTLTDSVRGKHVYLFSDPSGDYESQDGIIRKNDLDKKLLHDLLLLNSIRDNGAKSVNLVQACVPYARQDKTTPEKRQSASIDVIGEWIANMTQGDGYCLTIDIHNPASKSAFKGTNFINLYTSWLVESAIISSGIKRTDVALLPADQGGDKTVQAIAKKLELKTGVVIKGRDYSIKNSVDEIDIYGDIEGKDVFIHDDMLDTGGTMEKLLREILKRNPKSVNIVITHGMLNGPAVDRLRQVIADSNGIIQKVYISDSINKQDLPDFIEVISLTNILANTITGIYKGLGVNRGDNTDYTK